MAKNRGKFIIIDDYEGNLIGRVTRSQALWFIAML